jgi:long-chain acyl-CoA synthetase
MAVPGDAHQISFLPMAHAMARVFDHYLQIVLGFQVTCGAEPAQVGRLLPQIRPSFFASPPRLWEKLRGGLTAAIAARPAEVRDVYESTLARSTSRVHAWQQALAAGDEKPVADPSPDDARVLSEIASFVGLGRMRLGLIGGALVAADLIEFFHAIGVPLGEAYGLTECGAGATANPAHRIKCGTVGPALPGVELRLADDGWLRSGDIGVLDEDGYLRIIDRKKDIIINSAGKNMSPSRIEAAIKRECPLIGNAVVVGDGRLYNVAILAPDARGDARLRRCGRARRRHCNDRRQLRVR